ncbi:MAG: hypothetical protein U0521_16645 [Anaerolineae bacterium]
MTVTLERIIYGTSEASDEVGIIAISDHLTPQDAALWRGITSLKPMDASTFAASRAFGIFAGPGERSVWACAYRSAGRTFFEYIVLPREVIASLAGNLAPLVGLVVSPADEQAHSARIAPVKLNSTAHWTPPQRRAQVEALLARGMDMNQALRLLGAALHERGLMIHDFPADTDSRLSVVQGLMALLPARSRPDLTFSTNRHEKTMTQARVVFAPASIVTGRLLANWATHTFPDDEALEAPFIRRLIALWKGDLGAFLSAIDQMDSIASTLVVNRNLQNSLTVVAERHALDAQILAGEDAPPEALKAVMNDIPPEGDLKRLYAERLLAHALEARDADAALIVARVMDDDPELDRVLYAQLETDLDTQPDAVYSFVRTRLSGGGEDDGGRWAARLKAAALASLRVAITDGDGETAINWLRLVAREPASYDLGEVLHNGILTAQERACSEPDVAQALVLLAVRRDPAALETLLADDALLAALPNGLGAALRRGEGDPIAILQTYGVEVFLVALARALDARNPAAFTAGPIAQVWAIYASGASNGGAYSAERIVTGLINTGAAWLPADALETLLGAMLRDRRDDLSHQLIHQISQRDDFLALVVNAMSQSERSDSEVLALIAQMIAVGDLTQQAAVDVYVGLLVAWDWRGSALEIMEQLARAIQQHPHLTVDSEVIWNLLAVAGEAKQEFITRVALRRLTGELETLEDDDLLLDDLQRVSALVAWSAAARAQLLAWWRGYVREQSLARLQRIDRGLADSRRALDDLRVVAQSVIAFRRMLGKRSLSQFADDVATTYAVLQALAESFDPSAKRLGNFDPATVRLELDARAEELSPHELKIFANNLKELAQVIAAMGDSRSKATLIRRGDDVDRQLMTGEQQPHSAVDTLKWLAGYLGGTQDKPEADEDTP